MRYAILMSVIGSFVAAQTGVTQEYLPNKPSAVVIDQPPMPQPGSVFSDTVANPQRMSFSGDYLLWWLSRSPISVPLVATGAAVGDPAAKVRIGNSSYDLGSFSGGRFGLLWWANDERTYGLEGGGFLMQNRSTSLLAASNAVGAPLLYFPFQNTSGAETGVVISDPGSVTRGNVRVTLDNRLWGTNINGVLNTWRQPASSVDFLLGFRYYDLLEGLEIVSNTENTTKKLSYSAVESFRTRNQFFGGQLGARTSFQRDRLSATITGLVAMGANDQSIDAVGTSNFFGAGAAPAGTRSGFVYTQLSNIGSAGSTVFSVVPQLQGKLAYDLTSRLRATVAYDMLYWNNVVRPGQQIDHVVNTTQLSPNLGGAGALTGAANPAPQNNLTSFWAHGVSFGFEYRW